MSDPAGQTPVPGGLIGSAGVRSGGTVFDAGSQRVSNDADRNDFIRKINAAYKALAEVRCHKLGPPGVKGLQEDLLMLCEVERHDLGGATEQTTEVRGGSMIDDLDAALSMTMERWMFDWSEERVEMAKK